MIESHQDLWERYPQEPVVASIILTPVYKKNYTLPMYHANYYGSSAYEAIRRFPELTYVFGALITQSLVKKESGVHLFKKRNIITFPTRMSPWGKGDILMIRKSAESLKEIADKNKLTIVHMPRVGCGTGHLKWKNVSEELSGILDDRFVAHHSLEEFIAERREKADPANVSMLVRQRL